MNLRKKSPNNVFLMFQSKYIPLNVTVYMS